LSRAHTTASSATVARKYHGIKVSDAAKTASSQGAPPLAGQRSIVWV
jgi:hypothetical protein